METHDGVRGVVQVVDPPADGGGDEAGGAAVALLHQGGVLSHHDKETKGRANREKVLHLEVIGTVTLWSVVDQEREGGGVPGISPQDFDIQPLGPKKTPAAILEHLNFKKFPGGAYPFSPKGHDSKYIYASRICPIPTEKNPL